MLQIMVPRKNLRNEQPKCTKILELAALVNSNKVGKEAHR